MRTYLKNNPAKFHSDLTWNGAL